MADNLKLSAAEIVATTAPLSTDLAMLVVDPAGTPLTKKAELRYLLGAGLPGCNLIKNSPGQIPIDGAEPQWWDDSANATLTDEDAAGEGIPDGTERVFKLVTSANDAYGYQTFTFANEELLDAGTTVVTFSCELYCGTADKASIGIYGSNLGLQESAQVGASAWEFVTVPNITLHASDTSIEVRFICDTDTAFIRNPVLNLGSMPMPWMPRQIRYIPTSLSTQFSLDPTTDVAWSDTDCTANSDPLAVGISGYGLCYEPDGTLASHVTLSHDSAVIGADQIICRASVSVLGQNARRYAARLACDDSQVLRYDVNEVDADTDVKAAFYISGYWMWG